MSFEEYQVGKQEAIERLMTEKQNGKSVLIDASKCHKHFINLMLDGLPESLRMTSMEVLGADYKKTTYYIIAKDLVVLTFAEGMLKAVTERREWALANRKEEL